MKKHIIFLGLFVLTFLISNRAVSEYTPNTNFDWEYYVKVNNLSFSNEQQALTHYLKSGQQQKLEYCQRFKIAILLHLYNIDLVDEFIEKINYFMQINSFNEFVVKVNIPIDTNIDALPTDKFQASCNSPICDSVRRKQVLNATPYHKHLVTNLNFKKLSNIANYIITKIHLPTDKTQVIFSENRGLDIGGFFLLMDQLVVQNNNVDYIIKLHSKSNYGWGWRDLLTSVLNLRINKLLRLNEYVHTMPYGFTWNNPQCHSQNLINLFNYYKLPKRDFNFPAGSVFIASNKLVNFFKPYNFLNLFNSLDKYVIKPVDCCIEHAYERFFGYLCQQHLKLKCHIIDHIYRSSDEKIN